MKFLLLMMLIGCSAKKAPDMPEVVTGNIRHMVDKEVVTKQKFRMECLQATRLISRCENKEIVCYGGWKYGLQCQFKVRSGQFKDTI